MLKMVVLVHKLDNAVLVVNNGFEKGRIVYG